MNTKHSIIIMAAMIVNAMFGSGVFGLPQTVNAHAYGVSVLIGWVITGIGTYALAVLYSQLAINRPELDAGPYSYARAGLGDMTGFIIGWGYWLAALLANVTLLVLAFAGLGKYFPAFGDGNTFMSFLCGSAFIWFTFYLLISKKEQAGLINVVITAIKIIPILIFIALAIKSFDINLFNANLYPEIGNDTQQPLSMLEQIKSTMLATLWAFVGIEGASVVSQDADTRKNIGKATFLGFITAFIIYALVSILPLGIVPHYQLARLSDVSTADIMGIIAGDWGGNMINLGMIISVLGAFFVWMQYAIIVPQVAARENIFPEAFKSLQENNNNLIKSSEFISTCILQIFLLISYLMSTTYGILLELSTAGYLIPYATSAFLFLKYTIKNQETKRPFYILMAGIAMIFSLWLIYAAGLTYTLLIIVVYTSGLPIYFKYTDNPLTNLEKILAMICLILSSGGVYYISAHMV